MLHKYFLFNFNLTIRLILFKQFQDNGPLMRALAKLIAVNDPDLVLFVGEALVGNEAVDQVM